MLKQVLQEIESSTSPIDLNSLSRKLGIERTALDGMIRFWVQKGRLKDEACHGGDSSMHCDTMGCRSSCSGMDECPFVLKMPRTYSINTEDN